MDQDFGSLYQDFTRDAIVEDAAKADKFPTYPTGKYLYTAEKVTLKFGEKPDFESLYERPYSSIMGTLHALETGAEVGRFFVDISWEEHRVLNKKSVKVTPDMADDVRGEPLDRYSKLWGNIEAATSNGGGKQSIGAILDAITKHSFVVSISESFKTEDKWRSVKAGDNATREAFVKAGYRAFNQVNTIKALE